MCLNLPALSHYPAHVDTLALWVERSAQLTGKCWAVTTRRQQRASSQRESSPMYKDETTLHYGENWTALKLVEQCVMLTVPGQL